MQSANFGWRENSPLNFFSLFLQQLLLKGRLSHCIENIPFVRDARTHTQVCVLPQTNKSRQSAFVLARSLCIFSPMHHLVYAGRRGARSLSRVCLKPPSQPACRNITAHSGNERKRGPMVSTRDIQKQQRQPNKEVLGHHCNAVQCTLKKSEYIYWFTFSPKV